MSLQTEGLPRNHDQLRQDRAKDAMGGPRRAIARFRHPLKGEDRGLVLSALQRASGVSSPSVQTSVLMCAALPRYRCPRPRTVKVRSQGWQRCFVSAFDLGDVALVYACFTCEVALLECDSLTAPLDQRAEVIGRSDPHRTVRLASGPKRRDVSFSASSFWRCSQNSKSNAGMIRNFLASKPKSSCWHVCS